MKWVICPEKLIRMCHISKKVMSFFFFVIFCTFRIKMVQKTKKNPKTLKIKNKKGGKGSAGRCKSNWCPSSLEQVFFKTYGAFLVVVFGHITNLTDSISQMCDLMNKSIVRVLNYKIFYLDTNLTISVWFSTKYVSNCCLFIQ